MGSDCENTVSNLNSSLYMLSPIMNIYFLCITAKLFLKNSDPSNENNGNKQGE